MDVGRRSRRHFENVFIQKLQSSIWLYDACRASRWETRSSSGMVQRVQQSSSDAKHTRSERFVNSWRSYGSIYGSMCFHDTTRSTITDLSNEWRCFFPLFILIRINVGQKDGNDNWWRDEIFSLRYQQMTSMICHLLICLLFVSILLISTDSMLTSAAATDPIVWPRRRKVWDVPLSWW